MDFHSELSSIKSQMYNQRNLISENDYHKIMQSIDKLHEEDKDLIELINLKIQYLQYLTQYQSLYVNVVKYIKKHFENSKEAFIHISGTLYETTRLQLIEQSQLYKILIGNDKKCQLQTTIRDAIELVFRQFDIIKEEIDKESYMTSKNNFEIQKNNIELELFEIELKKSQYQFKIQSIDREFGIQSSDNKFQNKQQLEQNTSIELKEYEILQFNDLLRDKQKDTIDLSRNISEDIADQSTDETDHLNNHDNSPVSSDSIHQSNINQSLNSQSLSIYQIINHSEMNESQIEVFFTKNKSFGIGEVEHHAKLFYPSLDLQYASEKLYWIKQFNLHEMDIKFNPDHILVTWSEELFFMTHTRYLKLTMNDNQQKLVGIVNQQLNLETQHIKHNQDRNERDGNEIKECVPNSETNDKFSKINEADCSINRIELNRENNSEYLLDKEKENFEISIKDIDQNIQSMSDKKEKSETKDKNNQNDTIIQNGDNKVSKNEIFEIDGQPFATRTRNRSSNVDQSNEQEIYKVIHDLKNNSDNQSKETCNVQDTIKSNIEYDIESNDDLNENPAAQDQNV